MATETDVMTYILEQLQGAGHVTARRMFGEYAVYCDGRVVGLICDNQLFLKPTPGALALLGQVAMAPPYPGAKPHLLIDDGLEDAALMAQVVAAIARDLPAPKPKAPKRPRRS